LVSQTDVVVTLKTGEVLEAKAAGERIGALYAASKK
jgi:hypothetical protein